MEEDGDAVRRGLGLYVVLRLMRLAGTPGMGKRDADGRVEANLAVGWRTPRRRVWRLGPDRGGGPLLHPDDVRVVGVALYD